MLRGSSSLTASRSSSLTLIPTYPTPVCCLILSTLDVVGLLLMPLLHVASRGLRGVVVDDDDAATLFRTGDLIVVDEDADTLGLAAAIFLALHRLEDE